MAIKSEAPREGEPVSRPLLPGLSAPAYLPCGESVEAGEASLQRVTTAAEGRARR